MSIQLIGHDIEQMIFVCVRVCVLLKPLHVDQKYI